MKFCSSLGFVDARLSVKVCARILTGNALVIRVGNEGYRDIIKAFNRTPEASAKYGKRLTTISYADLLQIEYGDYR